MCDLLENNSHTDLNSALRTSIGGIFSAEGRLNSARRAAIGGIFLARRANRGYFFRRKNLPVRPKAGGRAGCPDRQAIPARPVGLLRDCRARARGSLGAKAPRSQDL